MSTEHLNFAKLLVDRGLGIYGHKTISKICDESGVLLLDDDSIAFDDGDSEEIVKRFMINYAKFNLIAKMTVMALAKQYGMEIPKEVREAHRKKSRFSRILRR